MQVQCLSNGQCLTLDAAAMLGAGGEALVYTISQDSALVAKVYRTPDKVQARKLAVMVTNPPDDPMGSHGHISIAWPVSLLSTVDGQQVIGFLMPRVTGRRPLIACYNPAIRRQQWPLFNADFRSAKSTHIPPDKPQCFSRTMDIFCEVIFCPIGLIVTPLLRGHHLSIASRGAPELPGRHVQWLCAMAKGNRENTSQCRLRVPVTPARTFALL